MFKGEATERAGRLVAAMSISAPGRSNGGTPGSGSAGAHRADRARWIGEGVVRTHGGKSELTLALVDVLTGIVVVQTTDMIAGGAATAFSRFEEAITREFGRRA